MKHVEAELLTEIWEHINNCAKPNDIIIHCIIEKKSFKQYAWVRKYVELKCKHCGEKKFICDG